MRDYQEMKNTSNSPWIYIVFLIPFITVLIIHAGYYHPFISDDSLISLRYAKRLLEGHGLTWTQGRPVEGYSNLLWILLVSFFGMFGADLIGAVRILGIIGMSAILFSITYSFISKNKLSVVWVPLVISLAYLSFSGPVAVWAIGGMEQPLYGALIAAAIPLMYSVMERDSNRKRLLYLSFALGLLSITRPDGPIFTVACIVQLFLIDRFHSRRRFVPNSLLILLFPVLFYGGQLIFRISYYGELVPNTALVKITPSVHHFSNGLKYLASGLIAQIPFSFLAIGSLVYMIILSRTRLRGLFLLITLVMWSAYLAFIGGDIFPAYRHHIPIIVIFAYALAEGGLLAVRRLIRLSSPAYYRIFIAISIILFIPYIYIQFTNKHNQGAIKERWEWKGKELGLVLKRVFSDEQPLIAVTASGCLPYWSELPALDMFGLNDYFIPRHPPGNIGSGILGHELGDGEYVLRREPDMIVFTVGSRPHFRFGNLLKMMPEFKDNYAPVMVRVDAADYTPIVYFYKYSDKIGIQYSSDIIRIPGFLLTGGETTAHINSEGKLVAVIEKRRFGRVTFGLKSSQNWFVDVKGTEEDKIRAKLTQYNGLATIHLSPLRNSKPVEIEEVILKLAE